ncbi:MAG: hypothetical protein OEW75_14970, partial [Cyclobacteriaceae bacterium]|nr:hypothetical protein [Cyclobacteriaceae bacterium]
PMVTDEAAAHIDLFPTLAKLTAIKIPDNLNLHGRNISDALTGKKLPDRMFFTHQVRRKLDTIPGALRTDKYLLTLLPSDTLLYNLLEDPFQKNPITQKVLQDSLVKAYQKWFIENTKTFDEYIPIQTGHAGIGKVELPATDIKETEGSHFYGGFGWANDWLVHNDSSNWTWGIKEVKGNRYELHLEYSLDSIGPEGVEFEYYVDEILKGKESLKTKIGKEKLESPDRVVRGEVYEYIWISKKIGEIDIPKGEFNFKLEVRGKGYFELKALHLVKI